MNLPGGPEPRDWRPRIEANTTDQKSHQNDSQLYSAILIDRFLAQLSSERFYPARDGNKCTAKHQAELRESHGRGRGNTVGARRGKKKNTTRNPTESTNLGIQALQSLNRQPRRLLGSGLSHMRICLLCSLVFLGEQWGQMWGKWNSVPRQKNWED